MRAKQKSYVTILGARRPARLVLGAVVILYCLLSGSFGSVLLDIDEFAFIREPYELIGGDYAAGYLKEGNVVGALSVASRAYYLYWQYRPLFSPIISDEDKQLFAAEEAKFGYVKPSRVLKGDPESYSKYSARLIVPEPDRFYSHGAGKPLLPALLSIPQLALVQALTRGEQDLLYLQHHQNYHVIFILVRLVQLLFGAMTICLVYLVVSDHAGVEAALWAAALFGLFPLAIKYFPNLHHDSIIVPFALLAVHGFSKRRYVLAGISFGLALASKNIAVGLLAAFLVGTLWERIGDGTTWKTPEARRAYADRIRGLAIVSLVGLVVLLPFANPVSYGLEILTPIVQRQYDPRGEDVGAFSIGVASEDAGTAPLGSTVRREVRLLGGVTRFDDVAFFFMALGLVTVLRRRLGELERLAFLVLLLVLPYGLVFGYYMSYRALMFVPFFVILCITSSSRASLMALLAVFALFDVMLCIDPVTTDIIHTPPTSETLVQAIAGSLGLR